MTIEQMCMAFLHLSKCLMNISNKNTIVTGKAIMLYEMYLLKFPFSKEIKARPI